VSLAGGCVGGEGVQGVVRGTVVAGPSDVPPGATFAIQDCSEAHIYLLAPVRCA
jgi:hypothetical protein